MRATTNVTRGAMLHRVGVLTAAGWAMGLASCSGGSASSGSSGPPAAVGDGDSSVNADSTPTAFEMLGIVVTQMSGDVSSGSFPSVKSIDPDGGSALGSREFSTSFDTITFGSRYYMYSDHMGPRTRQAFSSDYSKVVASKSDKSGSGTVGTIAGYLDESGYFHDMTALALAVGDFDISDDVMAAFGADDSFYLARKRRKEGNRKGDNISTLFRIADGARRPRL